MQQKTLPGKEELLVTGKGEHAGYRFHNVHNPSRKKKRHHLSAIWCYGRPLLQAWLLPDLNTIPNNCITENSL